MKNRNFIKNSIVALLPISLGLGVLLGVNKRPVEQVEGYSAVSTLPSTIDLNDSTDSEIRSYYSALNGKTDSELKGDNLLKNLKPILMNGQKYFSYDSGSAIWQIYEIADRDWNLSPASSISGYNATTKKITGYTYGSSVSSDKGTNPYVHALYHNRDVTNQARAWDSHGDRKNAWTIEREHVWPKSQGFEATGQGGARGDPMHLMAADGTSNGLHSNLFYGYVNKNSTYTDAGSTHSNCSGNLTGTSLTIGSNTVFEPQDSDKGDIARAIFYMVARYNYHSGDTGIDQNNPNLKLVQESKYYTSYTSSTTTAGKMGVMTDLLNWHHQDPVDEYEIHRNNILFKNYTYNRNPFIDFPEWADYIWGSVTYNGRNYVSNSTTPTGSADPETDTIHAFNDQSGGETVNVTGVTLDENAITIEVDGADTLVATVAPSNATNKSVTWTSSDTTVATVNNGTVRGVSQGTATITATSAADNTKYATCTVTVNPSSGGGGGGESTSSITITKTTSGASGGSYDGGEERTWTQDGYSFGSKATCERDTEIQFQASNGVIYNTSAFSSNIKSITVNQTTSVAWTLYCGSTSRIVSSTKADYAVNTSVGTAMTSQSSSTTMKWDVPDSSAYTYFALKRGSTVSYVSSIVIEFESASLSSISVKTPPSLTFYTEGDSFSPTGLVLTATYEGGSTEDIPYEDNEDNFEFSPLDNLQTGDTSVTISYGGKTCSQSITVSASTKTLSSISVSGYDTTFTQGDDFEFGGVVTAHYSDGSDADVTSSATITGYNMSIVGNQTVTVSYTYKGVTKNAQYSIFVSYPPETSNRFRKITSLDDIVENGRYIFGYLNGSSLYAMPNAFAASQLDGAVLTVTNNMVEDVNSQYVVTVKDVDKTNGVTAKVFNGTNYLGSSTTTNFALNGNNTTWTVTYEDSTFRFINGTTNRSILYRSDNNRFGNFSKTNIGVSPYLTLSLFKVVDASPTYTLVTDSSNLGTGDEVFLVGIQNSSYYEATTINASNHDLRAVAVTSPTDSKIGISEGATSFVVVREGDYLRFKDPTNGYLSSHSNTTNYTKYETVGQETNKSLFSITMDNTGLVTKMLAQDSSISYRDFKFHPTSDSKRFTFYKTSSTYATSFYFFKKTAQVEADTWSSDFLTKTLNCNRSYWNSLADDYDLLPNAAKQEILLCTAMDDPNYCTRSQAMARYELILARYEVTNFIQGRVPASAKPATLPILFGKNTNTIALVIAVSVISISAIGGYFFMKSRRKEGF